MRKLKSFTQIINELNKEEYESIQKDKCTIEKGLYIYRDGKEFIAINTLNSKRTIKSFSTKASVFIYLLGIMPSEEISMMEDMVNLSSNIKGKLLQIDLENGRRKRCYLGGSSMKQLFSSGNAPKIQNISIR